MCEEQVFFVENACAFSGQDFKETLSLRFKDRGGDLKRKGQGWGGGGREGCKMRGPVRNRSQIPDIIRFPGWF
jgi:hypothetical protein